MSNEKKLVLEIGNLISKSDFSTAMTVLEIVVAGVISYATKDLKPEQRAEEAMEAVKIFTSHIDEIINNADKPTGFDNTNLN